jgi:site-specific recombinase
MTSSIPSVVDFCQQLAPNAPYHKVLRELYESLSGFDPEAPLRARLDAFVRLAEWIRDPSPPPVGDGTHTGVHVQWVRLSLVLDAIERVPAWRETVTGALARVLAESSGVHAFAEVGVPNDRGFMSETIDRLSQKFLPRARDDRKLDELFIEMFPQKRDAEWLAELPPELCARVAGLLDDVGWKPMRAAVADAARLLCTRVSAIGLSEEIRARASGGSLYDSPFCALPRTCEQLVGGRADAGDLRTVADMCRSEMIVVHDHMERAGVSVDIVYRMDVIGHCLTRLEMIAPLLEAGRPPAERQANSRNLLATLVSAAIGDLSFRHLLRNNLRLIARKVIERVGTTGEHYITSSRREWWAMLRSAGGGGILTAGTAALKFIIGWAKLPLFVDGILAACNYAGSFLLMQLCGFTLATKQPSMTAAALADALQSGGAMLRIEELVSMIARMTRSQLAAAMGNVGLVIPAAYGLDAWTVYRTGHHFLDEATANYVVHSMDPLHSKVIWFATLTGIFLWLSSLGAGALENWAVYRRLPDAIAQHRIKRIIGTRATEWLSRQFSKHIAGAGGSVSLGFLLGLAPVFGKGFGLPIGVAHVTLSSGALTLAGCALGLEHVMTPHYGLAMAGIACIGLLNFGVSFALALGVAIRAREVSREDQLGVGKALVRRFFRRPMEFIFPPKAEADTPPVQHHH